VRQLLEANMKTLTNSRVLKIEPIRLGKNGKNMFLVYPGYQPINFVVSTEFIKYMVRRLNLGTKDQKKSEKRFHTSLMRAFHLYI